MIPSPRAADATGFPGRNFERGPLLAFYEVTQAFGAGAAATLIRISESRSTVAAAGRQRFRRPEAAHAWRAQSVHVMRRRVNQDVQKPSSPAAMPRRHEMCWSADNHRK